MKAVDLLSGLFGQPAPQDAPPDGGNFTALLAEAVDHQSVHAKQQGMPQGEDEQPLLPPGPLPDVAPPAEPLASFQSVLPQVPHGAGSALRGVRTENPASLLAAGAQPQLALAPQLGAADAREIARATDALAATPVAHAEEATPEEAIANEALLGQVAAQLARIVAPGGGEASRVASRPLAPVGKAAAPTELANGASVAAQQSALAQQGTSTAFTSYVPQQGQASPAPQLQAAPTPLPYAAAPSPGDAGSAQPQYGAAGQTSHVAPVQTPEVSAQTRGATAAQPQAGVATQPQNVVPAHPQAGFAAQLPSALPAQPPPGVAVQPQARVATQPGGVYAGTPTMPQTQSPAVPGLPQTRASSVQAANAPTPPQEVPIAGQQLAPRGTHSAKPVVPQTAAPTPPMPGVPALSPPLPDDPRAAAAQSGLASSVRVQPSAEGGVNTAPVQVSTMPTLPQAGTSTLPQAGTSTLPQAGMPALPQTTTAVPVASTSTQGASVPGADPGPQVRASAAAHTPVAPNAPRTQAPAWPSVTDAVRSTSVEADVPAQAAAETMVTQRAGLQTESSRRGEATNPRAAATGAQPDALHAAAPSLSAHSAQPSGAAGLPGLAAQPLSAQPATSPHAAASIAMAVPEGAGPRLARGRVHAYGAEFGVPSAAADAAPGLQTQNLTHTPATRAGALSIEAPGARPAETQPFVLPELPQSASTQLDPGMQSATPAPVQTSAPNQMQHHPQALSPTFMPPPGPAPVRIAVTTQGIDAALEGAQQVAEGESATARTRGPGMKEGEQPVDRLQTFTHGAAVGSTLSAYGGRGHQGAHDGNTHGGRDRDEREVVGTSSQSMEATARAFEQAAVHIQPGVEPRAADTTFRPQVPLANPVQVPDLPELEFTRAPVQAENASISLQHPDLGPIQLQVHRNQGRVEVHALIDSQHAEAVLRANESGIRYGVQQSGMTLGALRVRMRDVDDREQPTARGAPVRRRRMTERQA